MSWNLLICRPDEPLGSLEEVSASINSAFPDLEWSSPQQGTLPSKGGFSLDLEVAEDSVETIYTSGGFAQIQPLAALCKREGWILADAQEGDEVDLEDPLGWYKQREE